MHRLPAWGRTLGSRVAGLPTTHLVDSGLASHLLGLTARRLATRQPAVLTEFGHVLKTFVVNEALRQASWLDEPVITSRHRGEGVIEGLTAGSARTADTARQARQRIHVLPVSTLWA